MFLDRDVQTNFWEGNFQISYVFGSEIADFFLGGGSKYSVLLSCGENLAGLALFSMGYFKSNEECAPQPLPTLFVSCSIMTKFSVVLENHGKIYKNGITAK